MIVMKKAMSRRTVLRGMGTAVALPLLDAMVPALTAQVKTPAKAVRRLGVVYHPNGVIYENWLPKGVGRDFALSRTLAPLAPFRDQLIVVTGLSSHQAEALGDGGGDHSRASGSYLTGVHVKKSDSVVENGVSMDQIAAKAFEKETQLSSLQLTADDNSLVGVVRRGVQLRVQQHAVVADADTAADGGKQPARGLRAVVRLERQHGRARARGPVCARTGAFSIQSPSRVKQLQQTARSDRQHEVERLPRVTAGHGTAHPEGRGAAHETGAGCRAAIRCPGWVRAARAAALRPAGARLSVRPDEGDHVHVRPRTDRPAVSADRDSRTASSADAPSERRGEDGEVHRRFSCITSRCSRRIWRNCGRRRTATARCSIT